MPDLITTKQGIVTPEELAAHLKCSVGHVMNHWKRWGGWKIGDSANSPVRFDLDETMKKIRSNGAPEPDVEIIDILGV